MMGESRASAEFAMRSAELAMLGAALPMVLATCREEESKSGAGFLILQIDKKGVQRFWKPAAGIPDDRFARIAKESDARRGIVAVLLTYPSRLAGYALNTNVSPSWREMTKLPFAVVAEQVVVETGDGMAQEQAPIRPMDIDQDDDFL